MLLVQTYLARSTIEGIGCYARHDIRARTVVWRFVPGFDLLLDRDFCCETCDMEFIARYAQRRALTGAWMLPSDNARFINHGDVPNLTPGCGGVHGYCDFDAERAISAGEELTCDYRVNDADPWAGFGKRELNILKSLRFLRAGNELGELGDSDE